VAAAPVSGPVCNEAPTHLPSVAPHLTVAIRQADQVAAQADRPIPEVVLPHQDPEAAAVQAAEVLYAAEDDKDRYPCCIRIYFNYLSRIEPA